MKKFLTILTVVLSFIGISSVKADNLQLELYGYDSFVEFKSFFGDEEFTNIINEMIEEYKINYHTYYPYFDIVLSEYNDYKGITLNYYKEIPSSKWSWNLSVGIGWTSISLVKLNSSDFLQRGYYLENDVLKYDNTKVNVPVSIIRTRDGRNVASYDHDGAWYRYVPYNYYYSNYDLILEPISNYKGKYDSTFNSYDSAYLYNYDNFLIPKLDNPTLNTVVSYNTDDYVIEPYYLYDNNNISSFNYTEINLNDYAYVALALKDYNREAFSTNVQVKGQYCLTPVYNYGLTERKEILDGSKVDRCSPYYDNYTSVRTSILTSDLQNHAIYYLKAYDTSKDNYVKIDTTVFDVTLITEEEKDNPYVTVNGKTYPTIAYDELTDTATKSEDEGYVPGESEKFDFSDIFTSPIDFLVEVWGTIVTFFTLITSFIALLPPILQNFLYASFMLAIALGIVKIIL